jgi:hypothetical protein
MLAEILDIRYGDTRRMAVGSPHTVELNAEAFKRCRDLMIQSAVDFQVELKELIIDLEKSRLLKLNGRFTAAEIAQALADGGRAVNQAFPPIAGEDFRRRYRLICEMILYGCAAIPKQKKRPKRKTPKRK